ncbi:putative late blight resistance protein homolog R1A-10 [Cynara cardunculus var. scolymus]|uniref:Disease resistance protein n=1 Tax=Cynara cardunculus var. scolymus TaxID=59895 RepID=A0A103Y859_CYNCS|nr:putative late blight resistance protein homolog R1A-10 [Cynara cardunculus var. scolymus]KVI04289.1 Disease resistance protein [Cynara cardunculus var. scolymus]
MKYPGLQMFMDNLKQLIYCNHNLVINNPLILSQRPQFQLLYQELGSMIQILLDVHENHHLYELEKVENLMRRFKDAVEEAQDIIDLFLSAVHSRSRGLFTRPDVFKTSLDLENAMRCIESIKVEFMTMINIGNLNPTPRIDRLKTQSADAGTRNLSGTKKPLEEVVVGLDRDAELIRDKLVEDTKQLDVLSIVGMGGLGKTTLATKLFNDRFIVYHFHVRAWATVSQTYIKRDFLIQILTSIGVQHDLEEANDSKLREKLHKHLMGRRYLIVIDDIWSSEAWDDLKLFFPHENTGSRILLTSRLNEVALHAKPHGFVHSLPYLTEAQSWELLCQKVFHGDECPGWLIKPGMQIARKCQGLPLSVVVMAGILAKETTRSYLWENIACSVGSYILSDQELGCLETLALSYHHLPHHLRECFLYLGGFPEDFRINAKRLTWLWVAEGFIEEDGNRSAEETASTYLMDLVDRSLVIVAERKFNSEIKACKLHDLVRELCQQKAKEERFFIKIDSPPFSSLLGVIKPYEVVMPYKQRFVFTNQDINIVNIAHPPTPSIRSLFGFHKDSRLIYDIAKYFHSFALLRVLNLGKCKLHYFPQGMTLLVHLRYLAICYSCEFPCSICNLWSLQTLILERNFGVVHLPHNISDLVNLRHLWSTREIFLLTIEKPMNLHSISKVRLRDGAGNFGKCFPSIKKLGYTLISGEEGRFESLPYLETLKLSSKMHGPNVRLNHIRFPATLKKLTLVECHQPWSNISIIQSLPNLEVLKIKYGAFEGTQWNAGEQQFGQLKYLSLEVLDIKQWEAYNTSFPCLKRLAVRSCRNLEEIPLEIGEIATLELIEIYECVNSALMKSAERILKEQHDQGNTELKITEDGKELSIYLCEHEGSESE